MNFKRLATTALLVGAVSLQCGGQLLINEFSATNSDHLLVRESGQYPRVGNTVPWQVADYDDSGWKSGDGPFGFGTTAVTLGTDVGTDVQNQTPTLYLRKSFNVSSGVAASGSMLQLDIRYDDGFIAFLNGVEVARSNMGFPGMFAYHDQPAYNAHSPSTVTTIDLGSANSLLQSGENLLCLQVHNETASGGGDLLLAADLKIAGGATVVDGDTSWKYFGGLAAPSGGLVDYGFLKREAEAAPDAIWATSSFDDSAWPAGIGPVGFDASSPPDYLVGTDLLAQMRNITPSVYVRNRFTATAAEADSAFPLSLEVDFDDGMIVYLNGTEVFPDNVGPAGAFTRHGVEADVNHPATGDGGSTTDSTTSTVRSNPASTVERSKPARTSVSTSHRSSSGSSANASMTAGGTVKPRTDRSAPRSTRRSTCSTASSSTSVRQGEPTRCAPPGAAVRSTSSNGGSSDV